MVLVRLTLNFPVLIPTSQVARRPLPTHFGRPNFAGGTSLEEVKRSRGQVAVLVRSFLRQAPR